jgi:hypothetical protein
LLDYLPPPRLHRAPIVALSISSFQCPGDMQAVTTPTGLTTLTMAAVIVVSPCAPDGDI